MDKIVFCFLSNIVIRIFLLTQNFDTVKQEEIRKIKR